FYGGKDMPRKRLEGRSLTWRGAGAKYQRRRAGAEKPPVPYQTGRETLAAGGRFIPRAAWRSRIKAEPEKAMA
ncbi:TPA: hypothetical protein ACTXD9_005225, partial [Raoultella planticola]